MKKINLSGNIYGTSGYANHVRGLFNALNKIADVHLDSPKPPSWETMSNDAELAAQKKPWHKDGITIMVTVPWAWQNGLNQPCEKFYGYCVWEGDKVPEDFSTWFDQADGIIVPSTHVQKAIKNTFGNKYNKKVILVPHGVDTEFFVPQRQLKKFTFLANKGWTNLQDRGGVQYLVRAFAEEFRGDEPVDLKIKVNPAYQGEDLQSMFNKLNLPTDRPDILIDNSEVSPYAMNRFYEGHVFVNPTRAEGFSLPCLEALSAGLPVITTGYGGQTDFVNEKNGWIIEFELEEVKHDQAYEGISWALPNVRHLRKLLREAYEYRDIVAKKSRHARPTALKYTWDISAKKLVEQLK